MEDIGETPLGWIRGENAEAGHSKRKKSFVEGTSMN